MFALPATGRSMGLRKAKHSRTSARRGGNGPEKEGEEGHVFPRDGQKVGNSGHCKVLTLLPGHESCVREEKGGEESCRLPGKCGEKVGQKFRLPVVEPPQKIPARGEGSGHSHRKALRENVKRTGISEEVGGRGVRGSDGDAAQAVSGFERAGESVRGDEEAEGVN